MRVSRTQAEKNRQTVIDVASRQFRQHGYDGIGLKDLMEMAGLTQGAFYKQFASKEDLAAQASGRALDSAIQRWTDAAAQDPQDPLAAVIAFYLSMEHRAERMEGCPVVALGADAARQGPVVRAAFEAGIKHYLALVGGWIPDTAGESRAKAMALLSTMVGAVVLARSVNDETLAGHILAAAAQNVLGQTGKMTSVQ